MKNTQYQLFDYFISKIPAEKCNDFKYHILEGFSFCLPEVGLLRSGRLGYIACFL